MRRLAVGRAGAALTRGAQAVETAATGARSAAIASTSEAKRGGGFGLLNVFKQIQYKVFQLEADIIRTVRGSRRPSGLGSGVRE